MQRLSQGADPAIRRPKILVFDSGLGGLTVFREIAQLRPDAEYIYLADDAAFPYGALSEERTYCARPGRARHGNRRIRA